MPSWGLTTPLVDYFFRNYELSVLTRKSCCDIFQVSGNGDLLLVGATSQWTVNRQLSPGSSPLEWRSGIILQILWTTGGLAPQSTTLCAAIFVFVHCWMSPFGAQRGSVSDRGLPVLPEALCQDYGSQWIHSGGIPKDVLFVHPFCVLSTGSLLAPTVGDCPWQALI